VAQSLNKVATLYILQGKYAEAERLNKQSLAIAEKVLDPDHPDLAAVLESYARLLRKTGRDSQAAEMESRAAAIRAKAH